MRFFSAKHWCALWHMEPLKAIGKEGGGSGEGRPRLRNITDCGITAQIKAADDGTATVVGPLLFDNVVLNMPAAKKMCYRRNSGLFRSLCLAHDT